MKRLNALLLASTFLTTSCMLEEMGKRTEKMQELSEKLESYSSCMMRMNAGVMYKQMRSAGGSETRDHNFDEIGGEEAVKGMGDKLYHAAVFFKAFEHQVFSGQVCAESPEDLQDLYLNATNEFLRRIADYSEVNKKFDPNTGEIKGNILKYTKVKEGGPTGKVNTMMTFLSLATAMHVEHHYQNVLKRDGVAENMRAKTFYDILKDALRADANDTAVEYQRKLVSGPTRETMLNLLRARYNFLAVLAIKDLTNKEDMSFKQTAKVLADRLLNIFGLDVIDIELPMTYLKEERLSTLEEASNKLDAALKVRAFMDEMNISYKLDDEVVEILNDVAMVSDVSENLKVQKEFHNVQLLTEKLIRE